MTDETDLHRANPYCTRCQSWTPRWQFLEWMLLQERGYATSSTQSRMLRVQVRAAPRVFTSAIWPPAVSEFLVNRRSFKTILLAAQHHHDPALPAARHPQRRPTRKGRKVKRMRDDLVCAVVVAATIRFQLLRETHKRSRIRYLSGRFTR